MAFLLNAIGFSSPYWVSYKQAQDLGGFVKRGEKGCPVVFWKWLEVENKETGEMEKIPLLKYYTVFNLSQCEGIAAPVNDQVVAEQAPIQAAEQIVAGMPNRPEVKTGMDKAYYVPNTDYVGMPAADQFNTVEEYYSTLFHETDPCGLVTPAV